jgi:DNA-binding beta-propeller fold protein YncE
MFEKSPRCTLIMLLFFLIPVFSIEFCCLALEKPQVQGKVGAKGFPEGIQKFTKEGVAVEMSIDPVDEERKAAKLLMEGDDVELRFKISDTATGVPMSGVRPAAWIDPQIKRMDVQKGQPTVEPCEDKIRMFLQGSLAYQPAIDLNAYFMLTLNEKPSISVINPQLGFYITKLVTSIPLKSPGEDWALTRNGRRLFVTMPKANQVAVVEMATWKLVTSVDAGANPVRIAFQPDEKYLWVGNDGAADKESESGITVLDADSLKTVAQFKTGAGHHEFAFSEDNKFAFVTNKEAGTVSVFDITKLHQLKEVQTGSAPISLAFSSRAQAVYVAHEGDGKIVVIDGKRVEVVATIASKPGLRTIRFSPDGRWGLAVNFRENTVDVLDSSTNRILHTVEVGHRPDQISFTRTFAYVRAIGSDQVYAIQLNLLGKGETVYALKFPTGQPPEKSTNLGIADVIAPTPEGDVVLVANPVDQTIYYYMEGMLAPMGSFQTYGNEPRAVLVVNRSLRETAPGVYSTTFKLPDSGTYDIAFLLDSPRMHHCFETTVKSNPAFVKKGLLPLKLEFLTEVTKLTVGEPVRLRLKATNPKTDQPREGLKDLRVLYLLLPGLVQKRVMAEPVGGGIYEVEIMAPRPGNYNVLFDCQSLNVHYNQLPRLLLQATAGGN